MNDVEYVGDCITTLEINCIMISSLYSFLSPTGEFSFLLRYFPACEISPFIRHIFYSWSIWLHYQALNEPVLLATMPTIHSVYIIITLWFLSSDPTIDSEWIIAPSTARRGGGGQILSTTYHANRLSKDRLERPRRMNKWPTNWTRYDNVAAASGRTIKRNLIRNCK